VLLAGLILSALIVWRVGPGVIARQLGLSADARVDPSNVIDTIDGRVEIWSRAVYGIEDFPLTGMGMNSFRRVVHLLYPLFLISPDTDIAHAHNEFLQAALDLGIPGLIAFGAIYAIAAWMLHGIWTASGDEPLTRALVLGLGGGLLAHLVYGLTDAVALGAKPGVLFWMLLSLTCGLFAQYCTQSKALCSPVIVEVENVEPVSLAIHRQVVGHD
jgi:putative inorganic carbon (HCO3(-)) transporter